MSAPASLHASGTEGLAGKRALVMGLGAFGGGAGAARYLATRGARVLVTDRRPAERLERARRDLADLELEYVLGEHRPEDFERADLVVVNPAVRRDDPLLERARRAGARLTSEIELFLEAGRGRVVAVTGTQGKSSTTHLAHALLRGCGLRAHLGGNIGASLLPTLDDIAPEDPVVLELSSYQLEALGPAPPARLEAIAILNLLPDHLERHGTLEAYGAAKRRLLELLHPDGLAILPAEDPRLAAWGDGRRVLHFTREDAAEGLHLRDGRFRNGGEVLGRVEDLRLPGAFQRANALVALGLARALGAEPERLADALGTIEGLPHRLQDLGTVRGRRVIDNAVSTTPDSTASALEALAGPVVLLLGGRRKDVPFDPLTRAAAGRVALAVAFGEAGPGFARELSAAGVPCEVVADVEGAVALGLERGPAGAPLLFSPAASSFDAYGNFEERARAFRAALEAAR